jgi:signal peptidase I
MALRIVLVATLRRTLDLALVGLIGIVLAALVVARLIPALTHSPTFVVAGGSMEPAIHLGAVAVTEPVSTADLRPGDVVSLRVGAQHSVFTHRITRLVTRDDGTLWIATRGDANRSEDPSLTPASAVLGRVTVTIPYLGYLVQLLGTAQGVMLLVSLGLVTLLGAWLFEGVEDDWRLALHRRAGHAGAGAADRLPDAGTAA